MVTMEKIEVRTKTTAYFEFAAKSTDEKPTEWVGYGVANGSVLRTVDEGYAGKIFTYDEESEKWNEV